MFEYRVTKYNPAFRSSSGTYTRNEWTSCSDISGSFRGVVLTREEYERVEDAYVATALAFLREAELSALSVTDLENHGNVALAFGEDSVLALEEVGEVIRRVLRDEFWCRLEAAGGFVHVGYDYYMYVGVPRPCPKAERLAGQLGLFVEPFRSPYRGDEYP